MNLKKKKKEIKQKMHLFIMVTIHIWLPGEWQKRNKKIVQYSKADTGGMGPCKSLMDISQQIVNQYCAAHKQL